MNVFEITITGETYLALVGVMSYPGRFHDIVGISPDQVDDLTDDELCRVIRVLSTQTRMARVVVEERLADVELGVMTAPREKRPKPSNLYLMEANDLFKIGIGADVDARRKALSTASGYPVTVIASWPMASSGEARAVEAEWHTFFAAKRMSGEWFALGSADVALMKLQMYGIEDNDRPE